MSKGEEVKRRRRRSSQEISEAGVNGLVAVELTGGDVLDRPQEGRCGPYRSLLRPLPTTGQNRSEADQTSTPARSEPESLGGRLQMWASVSTTCPLYETELPNALIRRARTDGIEAAMRLLRAVLAVEEVPFFGIMPVCGLSVEKPTWTYIDTDMVTVAPGAVAKTHHMPAQGFKLQPVLHQAKEPLKALAQRELIVELVRGGRAKLKTSKLRQTP